ncbi:MAG: hypothetical protein WAQ05_19135 [Rubrivivax sp.]
MTFRNVVVGVLHADTYGLPDNDRTVIVQDAATALRNFRGTRIATRPLRDARWESVDSRPSMILAAPEYMLAKRGRAGKDDRLRDLHEKNTIEQAMRLLSSTAGAGLVLVPGSIAYAENFANTAQALKQAQTQLGMGTKATKIAINELIDQRKAKATPEALASAKRLGKLNPQAISLAGKKTPTTQFKRTLLNNGAVQFIAKNEVAMFHRGKEVARYAKICDFNEVAPSRVGDTVFIPGAKIGRATVGGIPWGIEVCFDHNIGVLNNTPTETAPRVHLLCSASVSMEETKSVVQAGGYIIHSSSDKVECGVWRRNLNGVGFTAVNRLDKQNIRGQAKLLCYEIELDLP